MTIKEWLNRGYHLNREINALLEARDAALADACKMTVQTDKERVSGTAPGKLDDKFAFYAEYTHRIDKMIDEKYAVQQEILDTIQDMKNNTYRTLLIDRYINFKTWEKIAERLGYSDVRNVYYKHGRALKEIGEAVKPRPNTP